MNVEWGSSSTIACYWSKQKPTPRYTCPGFKSQWLKTFFCRKRGIKREPKMKGQITIQIQSFSPKLMPIFQRKFGSLIELDLLLPSARQVLRRQLRHRRYVRSVRTQGRRLQGLVHDQGQRRGVHRGVGWQRIRPGWVPCWAGQAEAGIRTGDRPHQLHQRLFHVHPSRLQGRPCWSGTTEQGLYKNRQ